MKCKLEMGNKVMTFVNTWPPSERNLYRETVGRVHPVFSETLCGRINTCDPKREQEFIRSLSVRYSPNEARADSAKLSELYKEAGRQYFVLLRRKQEDIECGTKVLERNARSRL